MDTITVTNASGAEVGAVRHVRQIVDKDLQTGVLTYADAYSAAYLNQRGNGYLPTTPDRHPTEEAAVAAVLKAHAEARPPRVPRGLRLGANQQYALWVASLSSEGRLDDAHGAKLARKGLAAGDDWVGYTLTPLGRQVAAELFDEDGNRR
ncbi:hypothetical protein [Nocardiopsis tropica]|uniref:Uncharacterized protein n=1 Tax=Nocardiopsis tropica TaxID=109330 RepID=A0ABU7KQX8_9ACTN|nr:hypothetical protein [Nocardiopsis umidischolae]MEE2051681.1 hypothetical protein [Nocardiopsis umidischolae]